VGKVGERFGQSTLIRMLIYEAPDLGLGQTVTSGQLAHAGIAIRCHA
jgi:hypothetical protein